LLWLKDVNASLIPLGASNWVRGLTDLIGLTTKRFTQNEMQDSYLNTESSAVSELERRQAGMALLHLQGNW
jgi:hypothetical protein